jgi:hypothetical protein
MAIWSGIQSTVRGNRILCRNWRQQPNADNAVLLQPELENRNLGNLVAARRTSLDERI